jgi:hypothetical protein
MDGGLLSFGPKLALQQSDRHSYTDYETKNQQLQNAVMSFRLL